MQIRLYCFRGIAYKGHTIFNVADPPHTQKNLVCALRSRRRTLLLQGLFVNRGVLMMGECPAASYAGADAQSDREAAWQLCPSCVGDTWDGAAMQVLIFQVSLTTSCWMASELWTPELLLEQATTAYYLQLLSTCRAMQTAGATWEQSHWHRTTVRNSLFCVGNLMQRILLHPKGEALTPRCTMEDACEQWFGKIKQMVGHRRPTLKALLFAAQALHYRQKHRKLAPPGKRVWAGIAAAEAQSIVDRALDSYCDLFFCCGVANLFHGMS